MPPLPFNIHSSTNLEQLGREEVFEGMLTNHSLSLGSRFSKSSQQRRKLLSPGVLRKFKAKMSLMTELSSILWIDQLENDNENKKILKFRFPVFLLKEEVIQEVLCFPSRIFIDKIYDTEGLDFLCQENSILLRKRNDESVMQVTVTDSSSCYVYVQTPFLGKLPEKILEYKFKRTTGFTLSDQLEVDEILHPISYKTAVIKVDLEKLSFLEGVRAIIDIFAMVTNASFRIDLDSVVAHEDFLKLLVDSRIFPTPSKFMYSMKCLDPFDYENVYGKKKGIDDIMMQIITLIITHPKEYPQKGELKEYIWDMISYPQFFYTHHDPDLLQDVAVFEELNLRLSKWKNEFLQDDSISNVFHEDY